MEASSWHHKLFYFHLFFESGKYRIDEEKLQKFEYFKNGKSFFDEVKSIFS